MLPHRAAAGGERRGNDDQQWLLRVIEQIGLEAPFEAPCCPLCEEIECDSGCPLRGVRHGGAGPLEREDWRTIRNALDLVAGEWSDEEAVNAHMNMPHMADLMTAMGNAKIEAISINAYEAHFLKTLLGGG